ncbi:MAG TPA: glucosamine-6-phosphate deaminase, partial [Brevibacterium sp.]|nr:glucosamine-6-phosphate deaminase [Brevibacterium sp.]
MRITTGEDTTYLIAQAADAIERLVHSAPDAVLGIATGSSPEPLYAEITARVARG